MPPPAISSTIEPDGAGDGEAGAVGGGIAVAAAVGTAVDAAGVPVGSTALVGDGAADGVAATDAAADWPGVSAAEPVGKRLAVGRADEAVGPPPEHATISTATESLGSRFTARLTVTRPNLR